MSDNTNRLKWTGSCVGTRVRITPVRSWLVCGLPYLLLIIPPSPSSATSLAGLTEFSTDSNGNVSGGQTWTTLGFNTVAKLYVTEGGLTGSFLNSGNAAAASVDLTLQSGTTTFTIFGDPGVAVSHDGLSLFFDGNNTNPGISVFGGLQTTSSLSSFSADSALNTPTLAATQLVPGGWDDVLRRWHDDCEPHRLLVGEPKRVQHRPG